jgi:putative ABC transport system permease protein
MERLGESLRQSVPSVAEAGLRIEVEPLHQRVVSEVRSTLLVLFGAVGFVLLIACANVMNLMVVRTEAREREIAVRRALGSGARGIVRLLLAESLLLAGIGGLVGVGLAHVGVQAIRAFAPPGLPLVENVALDARVLGFALALSGMCALGFGLLPAFRSRRDGSLAVLGGTRHTGSSGGQKLTRLLVITQLSLSLVLLIGATLLASSLGRLQDVEPGFDPAGLLTFSVSLPGTAYERPAGTHAFLDELENRLLTVPGIESAGVVWPLPLSNRRWADDYRTDRSAGEDRRLADYRLATSRYFPTMRIPLIEGRLFGPADPRHVVVISQSVAERNWPGESAIGRRLRATPWGGPMAEFEVIGVVGDVRQADLREPAHEALYFDSRGWSWTDWEVNFAVRASIEPASLIPAIRELLADMDAQIPLAAARPMIEYVDQDLGPIRFALRLIGLFAALAGLLALIGLYGVVTYWVARRMREMGIRLAIGSDPGAILSLVLGQGARLAFAGVLLGTGGAYALTRLLQRFLYGVSPTDPLAFAGVALGLTACALVACALPALRAVRVDPMRVLRSD